MNVDDLWALFAAARNNGWDVPVDCFPDEIDPDRIFPTIDRLFRAFEEVAFERVNYVVLGQDPYYTTFIDEQGANVPKATGLAFGVPENCGNLPPSLTRIMRSANVADKTLQTWASADDGKGILLMNTALTFPTQIDGRNGGRCVAGAHIKIWSRFTRHVLNRLLQRPEVRFVCWGLPAKKALLGANDGDFVNNAERVEYSFHPMAGKSGAGSFPSFWKSKLGKELRMP